MSLKGSSSTSCVGLPIFMDYVDDSSLGASHGSCNTSIKDEPLDITECSLEDFKSELEDFDVNIKDEPFLEENTNNVSDSIEVNVGSIGKNTSGKKNLNNIIHNIKDGGEERTCILVKNPSLNDTVVESFQRARETVNNAPSPNKELFNETVRNFMITSPDKSHLIDHTYSRSKDTEYFTLTCSRCFSEVHMDNFRQHINTCFPRKIFSKKMDPDEANEHKTSLNQTVQTVYNPCTGKIVALSNNMNISNKSNRNAKISNFKSGHQSLKFSNNNLKNTGPKTDVSFPFYNEQLQKNDGKNNLFSTKLFSESKRGRLHGCNLCSYVTRSWVNFKIHKKCHVKKLPIIQCDKCTFVSTKGAMEAHKKTHTSIADPHVSTRKTPYGCNLCSYVTRTLTNFKNHIMCHLKNKPIIQCDKCAFRSTERALEAHTKTHTSIEDPYVSTRKTPYGCNLCSYVTRYVTNFKIHKMCHVKKMPIIQCDKCAFRSTKRALEGHKKTHISVADPHVSSSKTSSTKGSLFLEDNTFSCFICSFTTDKQQILKDHERQHRKTNFRFVQCFYCNQQFTRYMLYLHIKNIHPGERFLIDYQYRDKVQTESSLKGSISSFPTTEENSVERHVEKYDAQKSPQFKGTENCSLCSFSTNDKVTLRLHLRKHQFEPIKRKTELGRKFYDCRMCSYGRPTLAQINCHINSHRRNLPIMKCLKCDFRSTRQALRYHIKKCKNKNTPESTENSEGETSKVIDRQLSIR